MAHIITENEYVECPICGLQAQMLSPSHFKFKHNMSYNDFLLKYPNHPTITSKSDAQKRLKLSESKKGKPAHNKGKPASENQKRKQSESMKLKMSSDEFIHWNLGNKWSDDVKRKISKSVSKVTFSEEEKKIINDKRLAKKKEQIVAGWINPLKGRPLEPEHKQKAQKAIKKALEVKRNRDWDSIYKKCEENNITILSIDHSDGNRINMSCNICNTIFSFQAQIFRNSKKMWERICPICYPRVTGSSVGEQELYSFIHSMYPSAIANDRSALGGFGKELDVYIPELNIAFEYDGLYYHSDKVSHMAKNIQEKTTRCNNKGIRLIHVLEDEWQLQQELVKSKIAQILKHKNKVTLHARKLDIKVLTYKDCAEFMDTYHLQGKDNSKIRYGAFNDDELVAAMTFKPTNFTKGGDGSIIELSRFAVKANHHIPGIASKLFKRYVRDYSPTEVISYADKRWSEGNLYEVLGFDYIGDTPADYWYFKPNDLIRFHRSNFMKHILVKNGASPEKTESEIMEDDGYLRIYDCGSSKWLWKNKE